MLFPGRFHCVARECVPLTWPPSRKPPPRSLLSRLHLRLPRVLAAALEELNICVRGCFLLLLFLPAIATAHGAFWLGEPWRGRWMRLMIWTLHQAGPAFIKWGQWASTRSDLFPTDLCRALEQLQTSAPAHPAVQSRAIIEAAFGRPIASIFASFEDKPVASGSIAQIHRGQLAEGAAKQTGSPKNAHVAVKVSTAAGWTEF